MSKHGCKLYGVCSQNQKEVNKNVQDWRLTSFETVAGDNANSIGKHLKSDSNLFPDLVITDCSHKSAHPFLTKKRYPFGATQPAVIFFVGKKTVLRWCNKRGVANYGGALRRPDPEEVWKEVQEMKKKIDEGEDVAATDGSKLKMSVGCQEVVTKSVASMCTVM